MENLELVIYPKFDNIFLKDKSPLEKDNECLKDLCKKILDQKAYLIDFVNPTSGQTELSGSNNKHLIESFILTSAFKKHYTSYIDIQILNDVKFPYFCIAAFISKKTDRVISYILVAANSISFFTVKDHRRKGLAIKLYKELIKELPQTKYLHGTVWSADSLMFFLNNKINFEINNWDKEIYLNGLDEKYKHFFSIYSNNLKNKFNEIIIFNNPKSEKEKDFLIKIKDKITLIKELNYKIPPFITGVPTLFYIDCEKENLPFFESNDIYLIESKSYIKTNTYVKIENPKVLKQTCDIENEYGIDSNFLNIFKKLGFDSLVIRKNNSKFKLYIFNILNQIKKFKLI